MAARSVLHLVLAGREVEVVDSVGLHVPDVELGVGDQRGLGDQDAHLGCVAVALGRDDLAEVGDLVNIIIIIMIIIIQTVTPLIAEEWTCSDGGAVQLHPRCPGQHRTHKH